MRSGFLTSFFIGSGQRLRRFFLASGTVCTVLLPTVAFAQNRPEDQVEHDQDSLGNSAPFMNQFGPGVTTKGLHLPRASQEQDEPLDTSDTLLGTMGGVRTWLYRYGITLDMEDVEELWGNTSGGTPSLADVRSGTGTGPSYNAMTAPTLTVDLKKLIGLKGGILTISALQTRGRSITQDHLGTFNPISGYEADRSTRLFELWYRQLLFNDTLGIKIGQQNLESEFMLTNYGGLFLNSNFGWPMAPSVNLYSGGPSWPLSSPALRLRYRPHNAVTILAAVADDNPPGNRYNAFSIQHGGNTSDPANQVTHDGSGTRFNTGTGALLIGEIHYTLNRQPEDLSDVTKDPGLPGIYKLGGFYDTAKFPDYRYNTHDQLMGKGGGTPRWDRGNWMVYAVIDQMVWRPSYKSDRSLGLFFRATGNRGDRNLVSFAADAGMNFKAPFSGRPNDTVGIGWGLGRSSSGWRRYNRTAKTRVPGNENHLEITYQAEVRPWLVVQPDFQQMWNPMGGRPDPRYPSSSRRIGNETIFGLHTSITF
ncbi:carbohydrate porin [Acetobacter orleanensis]|uniref:Porin n=1 Tax=Acetobacter orleanensis TaxID=104099 RepID=A0A4Y3TPA2_9PROT|nr:carbohydrate porin [Acetobacter orleanensis]PCD78808.1 carbohydrate porin [Acetobacter orleanensis]GAN68798.1 porin B carbohydrate-selective OprB [Acetobacter orleanensis JCM 7639]GBR24410.1 carbohydrate-selective porin B [Acetobacter orleanensis NRIC 0473]GEB83289.1 porin [Acetobacter orleanensis]